MIEVVPLPPGDRRLRAEFLNLPFRLYQDVPQWVPPIRAEARRQLDRRRNPFFRHSEAVFLLALRAGRPAGRLAVLDPRRYNTFHRSRTAFFALFESEDDPEPARALFEAGFAWARQQGLDSIQGPQGFSALDGLGLLVRGFEHRPAFGIPYHPAYYTRLVEGAGFESSGDVVSGYLGQEVRLPERFLTIGRRVMERRGLRVARLRSRRQLLRLAPQLGDLYNQSLGGTSGTVPLTDDEVASIARQMTAYADPQLIKILYKGEFPVGFLIAYPDISAALQRSGGRMWPFGWIDWLRELRRTRWINLNGAGIAEGYRGLGGTALLFGEMYRSVREGGFEHADLVQIGRENLPMLREVRRFGVDFYKAHRLYRRRL